MCYICSFDDYIEKTYIKNYNANNSDEIIDYHSVSVCSSSNTYSVLQFQPQTELIVDAEKGLFSADSLYEDKVWQFIEKSFTESYDLITTPEYSVPLNVIKKLIENSDKIATGSLYCLCCNGLPFEDINDFLEANSKQVEVYNIAIDRIKNSGKIVCCLMYVAKLKFITTSSHFEKVFVIPQFKTTTMKDFHMEFETNSLKCGTTIVKFGKAKEAKFMSIICADIFNWDLMSQIKKLLDDKERVFLFHPQLNEKPQNDYFRLMREVLVCFSEYNSIKILSLNWAKKTAFIMNGKTRIAIYNSWSALYCRFYFKEIKDYMDILKHNGKNGLNIAHDFHVLSCFFSSEEHIIDIKISKMFNSAVPEDVQNTTLITTRKCYLYDKKSNEFILTKNNELCGEMIDDFFKKTKEFSKLVTCEHCFVQNKGCCMPDFNDFVSTICNNDLYKQFQIINDGNVTSISSSHYGSIFSREKEYICKRIFSNMKKRNVPVKFAAIEPNFEYVVKKLDKFIVNALYTDEEYGKCYCRIIYLKYAIKSDAEDLYNKLSHSHKENAENIIIYYENENGEFFYPDNMNTNITAEASVPNNSSIMGGTL